MAPKTRSKAKAPAAPAQAVVWTPEQLSQILSGLTQGETKAIKAAENALKPFLKHHACIQQLFMQLMQSPNVQIRHHAALLLKRKIGVHFASFSPAEQIQIRAQILDRMKAEPERAVATAVVGCVAALAKTIFATDGGVWEELFATLMALAQDPNPHLRAVNFALLEQLAENIASKLKAHMGTIAQLLMAGCGDADQQVKISAMKACTNMITYNADAPEVMALEPILPPLLQVMQACLAADEQEAVAEALEVIQECAAMEQPLINNHIDAVIPFIVSVMENKDYEEQVKQAATFALIAIIENRPKLIGKKNMVPPILNAMMGMIASSDGKEVGSLFQIGSAEGHLEDEGDEGSDDDDDEESGRNPQFILDTLAMSIPSKYFVQPALAVASQCISAADPQHRKAGCFLLGVITEGCADSLRIILDQILPAVLTSVRDPEYYVREVACFTLGQMSEHCQPEILHYHAEVLPVVFGALGDERPNVSRTSCYVLEYFCENLQPETLKPFLNPLLTKLCTLLQDPSKVTKEMALTAIAATAVAAEKEFLPFSDTICGLLQPLLFSTDDSESNMTLRGRALECLGHIAVALDKELFSKYFAMGMQSALESLQLKSETIKEYAYVFFANTGKIMQEQMAPHMATIMPAVLETIAEAEFYQDGDDDDDEDYDDDEDIEDLNYKVQDGVVNTKKAAITALGTFAQHGNGAFTPEHLEQAFRALMEDGLSTLHTDVRCEVMEVLSYLVDAALFHFGAGIPQELPKGAPVYPLSPQLQSLLIVACVTQLKTMVHDEEKRIVASAVEAMSHILERVGRAALTLPARIPGSGEDEDDREWENKQIIHVLMPAVGNFLYEKSVCQTQQVEEDDEDEDDDHDNGIIDQVADLVGVLAKTLGADFIPFFDQFAQPLLKFAKPSRVHTDRSMAIGCFGEVIHEIGPAAMKYVDALLPAIQAGLSDTMEGVRRNCAYCIGTLVSSIGQPMVPQYMTILSWLSPLCARSAEKAQADAGGADIDNALSSVARMISVSKESVPLQQVLPVMLNSLPLRADLAEGENIFQVLCALLLEGDGTAMSMLPQLLVAMGQTLEPESKHNEATKTITLTCVQTLARSPGSSAAFTTALAAMPDEAMKGVITSCASA